MASLKETQEPSSRSHWKVSAAAVRPASHDATHRAGGATLCNSANRTAYFAYPCLQSFSARSSAANAAPSSLPRPSAAAAHTDFAGPVVRRTPRASAGKETPDAILAARRGLVSETPIRRESRNELAHR